MIVVIDSMTKISLMIGYSGANVIEYSFTPPHLVIAWATSQHRVLKNRYIIDIRKECTLKIISVTILWLVDRGDCWFFWSIADIDIFMELICFHFEPKSRIILSRWETNNSCLLFWKGIDIKFQFGGGIERIFDFREVISIGSTKQILSIGTEKLYRNIIESFVKYTVNSNFTALRLNVLSNDILCGTCDISKGNTFSTFILDPLWLNSWIADPNFTANSTDILKIVFLSGRQINKGRTLSISRKCISDTQDMKKCKGPVGNGKSSTNQATYDVIGDGTMSTFNRTILWWRIKTGRKDFVLVLLEKVLDFWISI